ncbi:hypothetical protein POUND7_002205 [Theobroma cacao]
MKHNEEERPHWIFFALGFNGFSLFFGMIWCCLSLFKMKLKHPEENQSQILLVLLIILFYGFALAAMPLIIAFGLGLLSLFFNYPSEFNGNDKAECKETRTFPVWFTAPACILCCILVPISWRLFNKCVRYLMIHPEYDGYLGAVQLHFCTLGFTCALVFSFYFGCCITSEIERKSFEKKSLEITKISSNSNTEKKSLEILKISPNSDTEKKSFENKSLAIVKISSNSNIDNV